MTNDGIRFYLSLGERLEGQMAVLETAAITEPGEILRSPAAPLRRVVFIWNWWIIPVLTGYGF